MNNVDLIVLVDIEVAHPSTTFVGCAKKKNKKGRYLSVSDR